MTFQANNTQKIYIFRVTVEAQLFPDNFGFGAATSAFQCEGAWNASGKGLSILDINTRIVNHAIEGDVGSDSYYHYSIDVEGAKNMSVYIRYEESKLP